MVFLLTKSLDSVIGSHGGIGSLRRKESKARIWKLTRLARKAPVGSPSIDALLCPLAPLVHFSPWSRERRPGNWGIV